MLGARAAQQVVQVGDERIAELDGASHERQHVREHPRLVACTVGRAVKVRVPRMDGEARVEHAVLHPAHEQLRIGLRAREAAHVVPRVEEAGEGEADAHCDVVPECATTCSCRPTTSAHNAAFPACRCAR